MKIKQLDQHVVDQFSGMIHVTVTGWTSIIDAIYATFNKVKMSMSASRPTPLIGIIATGVTIKETGEKVFDYEVNCMCNGEEAKNQVMEQILSKFTPTLQTDSAFITLHNIAYGRIDPYVAISFAIKVEPMSNVMDYGRVKTNPDQ